MKLVLLLSKISADSQMLIDSAQMLNLQPQVVLTEDISFDIINNQLTALDALQNCDAVISRIDIGGEKGVRDSQVRETLLRLIPDLQRKMLNGESYFNFPVFSKLVQMLMLQKQGISVPNTYYHSEYQNLNFPLVLKTLHGSNGQQVHYITNQQEWDEVTQKYQKGEYLIQDPLPIGEDYRVIILGKKALTAYKRVSTSGFASNLSVGGKVEQVEPERLQEMTEIAVRAAEVLHCEYAGVDVMYDHEKKPRILEVNRAGGFSMTEIQGVDVAAEIVKYMVETRTT